MKLQKLLACERRRLDTRSRCFTRKLTRERLAAYATIAERASQGGTTPLPMRAASTMSPNSPVFARLTASSTERPILSPPRVEANRSIMKRSANAMKASAVPTSIIVAIVAGSASWCTESLRV